MNAYTIALAIVASARELRVCPVEALTAHPHHPARRALAPAIYALRSCQIGSLEGLSRILRTGSRGVRRACERCTDDFLRARKAAWKTLRSVS